MGLQETVQESLEGGVRGNAHRLAGFVGLLVVTLIGAEFLVTSLILVFLFYGLWLAVDVVVVGLSRWIGGLVMLVLGTILVLIGFIATWVGFVGLAVVGYASWLGVTGGARLDG